MPYAAKKREKRKLKNTKSVLSFFFPALSKRLVECAKYQFLPQVLCVKECLTARGMSR